MRKWHLYDLQTRLFTGRVVLDERGPAEPERAVALPGGGEAIVPGRAGFELPEGCGAIEWPANEPLNTAARRVNEKTGRVEPHRPDPPDGGDELRRWHWDEAAERYVPVPTDLALKQQRLVQLKAAIVEHEAAQERPMREMLLALAEGKALPAEAKAKLDEIEAAASALRDEIRLADKG